MKTNLNKLLIILSAMLLWACGIERPSEAKHMEEMPPIYPDYAGVTIPAEIAPMNFNIEGVDGFQTVYVKVTGSKGGEMEAAGDWADLDAKKWRQLAKQNRGGDLQFAVSVKTNDGQWHSYEPFVMHVSEEPLSDYGITYRKIAPGFETFSKIGIYQRALGSFDETPILEETAVNGQCLNCHYANRGNPDQFSIHVRGSQGGTLVRTGDKQCYLNTKTPETSGSCTYGYWHPEGRYCAYSLNRIYQNFYVSKERMVEPWDLVSDIAVLDTETNELITLPMLSTENCETTPAFSPDGKSLYYCYAPKVNMPGEYESLKYSICRVDFDSEKGNIGENIDTIVSSELTGKSLSLPRPSYDGKYLMYCVTDYGTTPVDRPESDLWLMDLRTGETRALDEINSGEADAYHNWSCEGNGWFLFGSRRGDGLYAQLFISRIEEDGTATKPFLLPQKNPKKYYGETLHSFNAPDFTSRKVELDPRAARKLVMSGETEQVKLRK